jgi:two-component system sensor histidine kinase YesM
MRLWTGLKVFWGKNSLRKRLIVYIVATILVMSAFNIFPYYTISLLMNKMSSTFEMNVKLNNLNKMIEKLDSVYESYLSTKYSKSLDDYYKYTNELKVGADAIKMDNISTENVLLMKDIQNMINTYLDKMNAAVTARRSRMVDDYLIHYKESTKIHQYINEYIQKLNSTLFLQNTDRYLSVKNKFYQVEALNIVIILSMLVLNIFLIVLFAFRITKPISDLSKAADEIAHGNLNVPSVTVDSNDEMGVMAVAFNRMAESIRQSINEMEEKSNLERRLQEKEMENLTIKSNLKEAELHALQAQINPHFLYNTLNTGAQLAMLDGADRACSFIENAAELFRYSMRNLDKPVTIGDEMRNVENYMHLLNERFADKIELSIIKDDNLLEYKIPCMILQPIVENAYIHGVSDVEYNGAITLNIKKEDRNVIISIKDNGKGMSAEKINEILKGELSDKTSLDSIHMGHTNGIGMNNILSRLKIFYNQDGIVDIKSEPGHGTEVILSIPINL